MAIERGITSTVLSKQMGHTSTAVTEGRYVHLFNQVRTDEAMRVALQQSADLVSGLSATDGRSREVKATGTDGKWLFSIARGLTGSGGKLRVRFTGGRSLVRSQVRHK